MKCPKRLQFMILTLKRYMIMVKYKVGETMSLACLQNQEEQFDVYKINSHLNKIDQASVIKELVTEVYYDHLKSVKPIDASI
ncbi:hypothetical protein J6590_094424 [Homalodisca vitripennis]|nr:hypothetical protein J6590_094424 [Homalodisca vitripennis]